ncbi:MAG TPA: hypothetical protein PLP73_00010 [Candidatus Absconditabacterales bacterium]|nr:hypothetical protein [Candidatus Absconditabacterales bacterium]
MIVLIKVYSNYWSDVVIHQQYLKQEVEIIDDLGSFAIAKFTLREFKLQKYNKVEIYEAGNPDRLIFKGYVEDIKKTATILDEVGEVVCWDGKGLLQRRGPLYGYNEVSTPMNIVVSKMMDHRNEIGDNWVYQVDYSTPIDMEYDLGTTCYNILQELADQVQGYWTVKDNKIIISTMVGEDKTMGSNEIKLFFDGTNASNVKEVIETQTENRANVAIGIGNDGGKLMVYDLEDYPYGVVIDNFQTGQLTEKTNSLLDRNNVDKRSIGVVLDENMNYNVNIGDKVNLQVEGLKTIEDFVGEVFVLRKTITYRFGKKYEVVEVGNSSAVVGDLSSLIKNINDKVDKIRNK